MSVDEAKVLAYVAMHKKGFKYWALYPKDVKARVKAAVEKGPDGHREYFAYIVGNKLNEVKGMNEETQARAIEACMADEELIATMITKGSPKGGTKKTSGAAPPPSSTSEGKEGALEMEKTWINPIPLMGKKVGSSWKHLYCILRSGELCVYDNKPKATTKSGKLVPSQAAKLSMTIQLAGACVTDTKQVRKGKFAFRLNYATGKEMGTMHKMCAVRIRSFCVHMFWRSRVWGRLTNLPC
jgi:hypothetical protein